MHAAPGIATADARHEGPATRLSMSTYAVNRPVSVTIVAATAPNSDQRGMSTRFNADAHAGGNTHGDGALRLTIGGRERGAQRVAEHADRDQRDEEQVGEDTPLELAPVHDVEHPWSEQEGPDGDRHRQRAEHHQRGIAQLPELDRRGPARRDSCAGTSTGSASGAGC